ncbi:plastocyanin/azurin family copper-binding protein [Halobacterium noricense]|uniref:plastocyanin/azurin family copper-binding protein n=1 Tax=Halobacterium noricense TaxID=223182 RepID=UPI001E61C343|nr:plastocyanin/azurin family copper-binding protein [Halobacterium noricense]UHH25291.1 plastocyanin/azurin family copper-binding protein [Halobacterium noricense]
MDEHYSRRRFLASTGVVGVAALAGCSGGGDSGGGGGGGETTAEPTETESGGSGEEWTQTSTVEMTDELVYEPERIEVEAGTTVTWETTGAVGHTVTAYEDNIPDGASYFASGGFNSEQAAIDGYNSGQEGNVPQGETYEHTFETTGTYEYYCIPHEMSGMVGYVRVV